ncbi:MAG TPA: PilN domain-containing protein [Anaerohalosphaeraceae bacterium]|jgi:Tfp pilus assembly protein PilN|nr:PilN domain-containing protein [Anaerohalosphaeraceae bacterium]HRT52087.1 PilN domain-containing protein [Anaerohalosphaeraceae bacterium]HRT88152.1 PilN domain-containing protein [Anaerohalosphaeraceae bacterium]
MSKIDFVPNDYIQQRESNRANLIYLVLFAVMMGAIAMTFSFLKMRQRAIRSELTALTRQMAEAQEEIAQLEELKTKSKTMMKTMLMTAELLEPVPRSVILAGLTNSLPAGVSLLEVNLVEKETATAAAASPASGGASRYKAASAKPAAPEPVAPKEVETNIEIKGIAPSDIEVATYIARLGDSVLLESVSLVESKEHKIDETRFREFKLETRLKKGMIISKEDITRIRQTREQFL